MKWINIKDRLPEDGQFVICCFDNIIKWFSSISNKEQNGFGHPKFEKGYVIRQLKTEDGKRWADEGITHWMLLPEPPDEN